MEERTWTVALADGTKLPGLRLNGNNFLSTEEVTKKTFEGKLSRVEIVAEDGAESYTLHDAELVQITPASETPDGKLWFILRQPSEAELRDRDTDTMLVDQEYRLTLLELGVDDTETA